MSDKSLSHSKWDCKYHFVFIPKGRRKKLYGKICSYLGPVFHELAGQRGSRILEGHMVQDHVHMLIEIPPKYAVSEVIGYLKGKVRYQSLVSLVDGSGISIENPCGQEAMPYPQ